MNYLKSTLSRCISTNLDEEAANAYLDMVLRLVILVGLVALLADGDVRARRQRRAARLGRHAHHRGLQRRGRAQRLLQRATRRGAQLQRGGRVCVTFAH